MLRSQDRNGYKILQSYRSVLLFINAAVIHLAWSFWSILNNKKKHHAWAGAWVLQQSDSCGLRKDILMSSFEQDKASREKTPTEMPSQALAAQASCSNVGAFGSARWMRQGVTQS